jgi:hypothetical protein
MEGFKLVLLADGMMLLRFVEKAAMLRLEGFERVELTRCEPVNI